MFTGTRTPRPAITPVAGQRASTRLINGTQTHYVDVVFEGSFVIGTANAAAILNRGSILAAFDEIGISENGTDRVLMRPRVARAYAESLSTHPLSATRLTSVNVGTTTLRETVRIWLASPLAITPRETAFREHDTRQELNVFVKLAASGGAANIATAGGGGGTVALNNLKVEVVHKHDPAETKRPYFIPNIRQTSINVTGANAALELYVRTNNALRALIVSQETTGVGEVTDVINGLVFRGDNKQIIGPTENTWTMLNEAQQEEFGGDMTSLAYLVLNFQEHGRLSRVLNAAQDVNQRFEFDCQPSASAGTSQIIVTLVELIADPLLCDPKLPFAV